MALRSLTPVPITSLPAATTPLAGTELVSIVQGGTTSQTTVQAIMTSTVPSGTANGVLYLNGSKVVTSGSGLVFDASGRLGLGVTPSAWGSIWKAQQLQVGAFIASQNNADDIIHIGTNAFANASNVWTYINTAAATRYQQYLGAHSWYSSTGVPSAGGAISFTQAMTLDASGYLLVGATSSAGVGIARLQVGSTSAATTQMLIQGASTHLGFYAAGAAEFYASYAVGSALIFGNGPADGSTFTERARITSTGNVVAGGSVALATNATDGFLYVPTCAGTPTGTPAAITGMAPIVVDTTNNKLYFYSTGTWRDAGP